METDNVPDNQNQAEALIEKYSKNLIKFQYLENAFCFELKIRETFQTFCLSCLQ